jgi:ribonuclease/clavin/mitogillin
VTTDLLARIGRRGLRLEPRELAPGLMELRMRSAALDGMGFPVCAYLVDEVLIDTGFAHMGDLLVGFLRDHPLRAIALTHHHEDHSGNAGRLAAEHGCPVYLREPQARWTEGLGRLPRYRRLFYGVVAPYEPQPMPAELHTGARTLRCVASGGHSQTHTVFHEHREGLLFTGDLYVSRGASAVMRHEDPHELLDSLRRVAALGAQRMLAGHGVDLSEPGSALTHKLERLEAAVSLALQLHDEGHDLRAVRQRVFPRGAAGDLRGVLMTWGEFSRANLIRAAIRHRPSPPALLPEGEGGEGC